MTELKSGVTVVLGGQWGDEGKGKLVDILAQEADVVARCQVRESGWPAELTGGRKPRDESFEEIYISHCMH